jgi:hypothetical protein
MKMNIVGYIDYIHESYYAIMDKFCETRDEWKANGRRGSVGAEN